MFIGTCVGIGLVCATIWYFSVRLVENKKYIAEITPPTPPTPPTSANSSSLEIPTDQVISWVEPTLLDKKAVLEDLPWYVDACLSLNDFTFVIGSVVLQYTCIQFVMQIIIWGDDIPWEVRKDKNITFRGKVIKTFTEPKEVNLSRTRLVWWRLWDVVISTFVSRAIDSIAVLVEWCFDSKGKTLWAARQPRQEEEIIKNKWDTYRWWWSFFCKKNLNF